MSASVRLTLSLVVFQFVHHRKGVSLSPNTHANTQPRRTVVRKVDAEDEKGGCRGRERWMRRTNGGARRGSLARYRLWRALLRVRGKTTRASGHMSKWPHHTTLTPPPPHGHPDTPPHRRPPREAQRREARRWASNAGQGGARRQRAPDRPDSVVVSSNSTFPVCLNASSDGHKEAAGHARTLRRSCAHSTQATHRDTRR